MSPILKRDISETVKQARRLAAAAGLGAYDDDSGEYELARVAGGSGSSQAPKPPPPRRAGGSSREQDPDGAHQALLRRSSDSADDDRPRADVRSPSLADDTASDYTTMSAIESKWSDLRGMLLSSTPSLLIGLLGNVFSGELLEHCARWRVFRRVDELFILVPMIGNLKGNLEMCLSARLGTSAMLGELDSRRTRRGLLLGNMTLLVLQALLISSLAAVLSFCLGLVTTHRLGDVPSSPSNTTTPGTVADPTLNDQWNEGNTRPGLAQLLMVLATGMSAAGLSSLTLGSFMSSTVVVCRWARVDPDNITPPVAACLGDLVTLFILALVGTALVGAMDTPVPLIAVVLMVIAGGWFTRRVLTNDWVKAIAKGSWAPLIGAMLISSGTGMVLSTGVARYRGFALLAIAMTGLTGSLGAIHANRLSTSLHMGLHPGSKQGRHMLTPGQSLLVLFCLSLPCEAAFLAFVNIAGWIDVDLGWVGWVVYLTAVTFSLLAAHYLTLFCWRRDLDPDSYTLPIHSAIVDFVGQLLLMLGYELCRLLGNTSVMEAAKDAI